MSEGEREYVVMVWVDKEDAEGVVAMENGYTTGSQSSLTRKPTVPGVRIERKRGGEKRE